MTRSILRKWAMVFSILALGFLCQNCLEDKENGNGGGDSTGDPQSDRAPGLPPVSCIDGFIGVPGNSDYGTEDFCVMKYEAKALGKADGPHNPYGCGTEVCGFDDGLTATNYKASSVAAHRPWVRINRAEAIKACEDSDLELMTNDQWQTIARNIELVAKNWANDRIGDAGGLNRGHSDDDPSKTLAADEDDSNPCVGTGEETTCEGDGRSQKRTHIVSNRGQEEVIWDIGGNVSEWVKDSNETENENNVVSGGHSHPIASSSVYISTLPVDSADRNSLTGGTTTTARTDKDQFGPSGDYSSLSITSASGERGGGLGSFREGTGGGVFRGGDWDTNRTAGVFSANLSAQPSTSYMDVGFRCVYSPESE